MSAKLDLQVDFTFHKPTIFVGLGGAGLEVINRIAGNLKRRDDWSEIQNIYRFFALDTDRAAIDACQNIPMASKFIISNFDKGMYIEDKRGRLSKSKADPDPRVVQWVHDWYNFRSSQGVGAGQIRVEARLSLYNAIESTDLIARIEDAISKTIHISNSYVDTRVKTMNIFLYFSTAGGTGSGSHLLMAALLRHIAAQFGWSAKIIGICMLPTLFLPLISNPRQRDDILANGYSALKEIEHMMKIKATADDPSRRTMREFVYHPFIKSMEVTESPFDFVYIADTTTDLFVDKHFRKVVADAIYLQMFSPIFALKDSDYDNYEKNQKRLARGLHTVHYGSFGCSLLILPTQDILEYCAIRQTADIFSLYLTGKLIASDDTPFIPENDLEFKKADPERQNEIRDRCFCQYIDHEVQLEKTRNDSSLKFFHIKEKCGLSEECNFEDVAKLDKLVTERLSKDEGSMNEEIENLFENATLFEPWCQNNLLMDIWKTEAKGIIRKDDQEDDQEIISTEGKKYFGLRGEWEREFREILEKKNSDIYAENKSINIMDAFERCGVEEQYRSETQHAVDRLTRDSYRRLKDMDRALDHLAGSYRQLFNNTHFIANIFSNNKADIFEQRYFSMALAKELASRKIALELLKGEFDPAQLHESLDKFIDQHRESLNVLYKEAEITGMEKLKEYIPGQQQKDADKFRSAWEQHFAAPLTQTVNAYETFQKYNFLYQVYSFALEAINKYLNKIREFYGESESAIGELQERARRLLRDADRQANEFELHEEALRDLAGTRLWDKYYEWEIKGKTGGIEITEIMDVISQIFSSEIYRTNYDRTAAIQDSLIDICRARVEPIIVGVHKTGREERGLELQKALELEGELKFVDYLKAVGFWNEWEGDYRQHRSLLGSAVKKLPGKIIELRKNIHNYTRNYLEFKFHKCIRNSQVLANINVNDNEVVEFCCRQSMMIYDQNLYGEAKEDGTDLQFPSIVKKVSPGIIMNSWTSSNMVIFYTALLGVPLFCFRNIVGQCKEAYNRRIKERRWDRPHEGRQYPLHIDKNWEPDDPSIDRSKLPMALDPDEAVDQRQKSSEDLVIFFEMFIQLVHSGDIVYDNEKQVYLIPEGRLGNSKGPAVILGRAPREAVIALLSAIPAHQTITSRCRELSRLTEKEIMQYKDMFSSQAQIDIWHDEKLDPELASTINLLDDLLSYYKGKEQEVQRKATKARIGRWDTA